MGGTGFAAHQGWPTAWGGNQTYGRPVLTPSMRIALDDLKLEQLVVLYPGKTHYTLAERVKVAPLSVLGEGDAGALFARPGRGRKKG